MEAIKEELKNAINEELSISLTVSNEANVVIREIEKMISDAEQCESEIPCTKKKTFTFERNFIGVNVCFNVFYYNFISKESLFSANGKYDYLSSYSYKVLNKWYVGIRCYGVSGGLSKDDLSDSVQHELEHIFQGEKGNGKITEPSQKYFNIAANLSNSDEDKRRIAEILYISTDYEQDAFVNGLYANLLSKKSPIPYWGDIKDSEAYAWLKKLDSNIEYINDNYKRDSIYEKSHEFGLSLDKLIKIAEQAKRRLLSKIGKVLIKVRKDKISEGINFKLSTKSTEIPYFEEYDSSLFLT